MRRTDAAAASAAAALEPLLERFADQTALIFASGPSLTKLWSADRAIPCPSIAVNDAHRIAPGADILHASDGAWWRHHKAVPEFAGLKTGINDGSGLPKGVVELAASGVTGYDERRGWIKHGENSGTAAVHLAAQLGATRIVLVGFDLRRVDGQSHFFGEHPRGLQRRTESTYAKWLPHFEVLAEELQKRGVTVLNATPGSALTPTFGYTPLEDIPLGLTTLAQQAELAKYDFAYREPNYHMSEQRAAAIRRTLEELPWRGSYLDVSCGRGEMLRFAREIGFATVAGTEVVPELIGGDVSYALAWDLPFGDRSFEVVSMLDVIEHLLPGDDELACRELARVATRAILLTANNLPSHPHGDPTIELHVNKRPYPEWDRLFRAWFPGKVTWLKHRVAKRSELWMVELA